MIWPRSYDPRFAGSATRTRPWWTARRTTTAVTIRHRPIASRQPTPGRRHPGAGLQHDQATRTSSLCMIAASIIALGGAERLIVPRARTHTASRTAPVVATSSRGMKRTSWPPEGDSVRLELWDLRITKSECTQLCYRAVRQPPCDAFQPVHRRRGKGVLGPGEGKVFGGINVDIGASKTITDSTPPLGRPRQNT